MSEKIDKVFDLLEKVYVELQETKSELKDTKIELKDTKNELKNEINKVIVTLEHDIKPNIKILFEAQAQTNEHLVSIDHRFDILETKVDALSAKTLRQSYEIGAIKRKEARGI